MNFLLLGVIFKLNVGICTTTSKRHYKEYLWDDKAIMRRTTRWRSEKCYDENSMIEPNTNITSGSIMNLTLGNSISYGEPISEVGIDEASDVSLDS